MNKLNKIKHYFHTPLCEQESFLFLSLIIGFALFCHLFTIFSPNGISENEEWYIFYLFFGICPLLTHVAYKILDRRRQYLESFLFVNGYLALFLIIALIVSIFIWNEINPNWIRIYSILQIVLTIITICPGHCSWRNSANKLLVIIFPVAFSLFLLGDFLPVIITSLKDSSYQGGIGLGVLLSSLIVIFHWLSKFQSVRLNKVLRLVSIVFLCLVILHFPLFFLEDGPFWSLNNGAFAPHVGAYTGPAYSLLGGRLPLVDAFSQYGMFAFLPYTLAFIAFSPSFLTAGVVTATLSIAQNLVLLLILNKSISNKILVGLGAMLTLLLRFVVAPDQQVVTPSTYGARFFLPLLLILAIIYLPSSKLFNFKTVIVAWLCSLWSIENFLWGLGIYSAYAVGFCVIHNANGKRLIYDTLKKLSLVAVCFLSVHVAYSLVIFSVYGTWPRYDIYLEMVKSHTSSAATVGWVTPIRPLFLMWGFFVAVYFLVFAYFWKMLTSDQDKSQQWVFVKHILPVAVLGTLELTYYLGRSIDQVLIAPIYPLSIAFFVVANHWLFQKPVKYFYSYKSWLALFLLLITFTVARCTMAMKPLTNTLIVQRITAVYSCLITGNGCYNIWEGLKTNLQKVAYGPPLSDELSPTGTETYQMILKYYPVEREVVLLQNGWGWETEHLLMLAKKFHKFPISSSGNDWESPTLIKKIAESITSLKEGDILIQQRSPNDNEYAGLLLKKVKDRWKLCLLEQKAAVEVYKVVNFSCEHH
jgi:hypothetical protein